MTEIGRPAHAVAVTLYRRILASDFATLKVSYQPDHAPFLTAACLASSRGARAAPEVSATFYMPRIWTLVRAVGDGWPSPASSLFRS